MHNLDVGHIKDKQDFVPDTSVDNARKENFSKDENTLRRVPNRKNLDFLFIWNLESMHNLDVAQTENDKDFDSNTLVDSTKEENFDKKNTLQRMQFLIHLAYRIGS